MRNGGTSTTGPLLGTHRRLHEPTPHQRWGPIRSLEHAHWRMTQPAHWRPANLPPGTPEVVIVDDTPNPNAALEVRTPDGSRAALVRFDQLATGDQPTPR